MVSTKGGLRRYAHRSIKEADSEFKHRQRRRYRVTTINWTLATIRGKVHQEIVHRNEYSFTLRNLIKFIRETEHVAEDIIAIEPEPAPLADIQAEFEEAIREYMGKW